MNTQKKIVVGISGGIDSAVTAAMFKHEGYEVHGIHLVLSPEQENATEAIAKIESALDIKVAVKDVSLEFDKEVIGYFRSEHLRGNSPSPCAICNPDFKWKQLAHFAKSLDIKEIGTGHYIQKVKWNNKWWLKRGLDNNKDQSYFLWGLGQEMLERITTPLGEISKEETKNAASTFGLNFLEKKKESTGLCFAGNLSYPELLRKHITESANIPKGKILDIQGNHIGYHNGYIFYTIGQKKELDFFKKEGLCVVKIIADENILIAGKPTDLWKTEFKIRDFKFVDLEFALNCEKLEANVRGFGWNPEGFCKLKLKNKLINVTLENPAWAPAPGQPAVFYYKNMVVGGGMVV